MVCSVNKSLKGKWAALACHETGSLVVQVCSAHHCPNFIPVLNLPPDSTPSRTLRTVQRMGSWMNYSIKARQYSAMLRRVNGVRIAFSIVRSHFPLSSPMDSIFVRVVLEHGSEKHRQMTVDHLISGLLEYASNEQGSKSVTKALKEGGKETLDKMIKRMCDPAKG
jgi:pumilio RNA-binding family